MPLQVPPAAVACTDKSKGISSAKHNGDGLIQEGSSAATTSTISNAITSQLPPAPSFAISVKEMVVVPTPLMV